MSPVIKLKNKHVIQSKLKQSKLPISPIKADTRIRFRFQNNMLTFEFDKPTRSGTIKKLNAINFAKWILKEIN